MPTKSKSHTKAGSKNKKTKISSKLIAAIIIGVVAIAGIVIIFDSFASGPPAYQYSYVANCQADKKDTAIGGVTVPYNVASDCVKNSAEEMAYRLYAGAYGKVIDYNTYKDYVQKLAGDRLLTTNIVPESALATGTDQQYITNLYKNIVYRSPSTQEVTGWINQKNNNKLSREDLLSLIAQSAEAKNANAPKFAQFLKANPNPVAIVPTAQNQQNARAAEAKQKSDRMKTLNDAIQANTKAGLQIVDYKSAKTLADQVSKDMIESKSLYDQIESLTTKSSALTKYATNISDSQIRSTLTTSYEYLKQSWTNAVKLGTYVYNLDRFYTAIANSKKTANKSNQAANNNRSESSGSSGSAVSSVDDAKNKATGCTVDVKKISRSSSRTCIKKLQQFLGVPQSGVWDSATQGSYDYNILKKIPTTSLPGTNATNTVGQMRGKCIGRTQGNYYYYNYHLTYSKERNFLGIRWGGGVSKYLVDKTKMNCTYGTNPKISKKTYSVSKNFYDQSFSNYDSKWTSQDLPLSSYRP